MRTAAIRHNLSSTTPAPRDVDKAREIRDKSRKAAARYFDEALKLTKMQLHVEAPAPARHGGAWRFVAVLAKRGAE
jgi:hypothetical protein